MRYNKLGDTDLNVSAICLGSMTWGEQNTESEGHAQLNRAVDAGVNFIDTAEMYPVPPRAETGNATEQIIGNWLADRTDRDSLIIATKAVGRSEMTWLRDGEQEPRANKAQLRAAVHASLKRLQTEYIDLYQIHWPDRATNFFGKRGYPADSSQDDGTPISETIEALDELKREGLIRHYGLSNESAWGTMKYVQLADKLGVARPVSIQNPYSLLNRSFEVGLSEVALREDVGLLAYSPLAFGMLTGKYDDGARPKGARLSLFESYDRYLGDAAVQAAEKYNALARDAGLTPAALALAWINNQPFVTSNIIGATTLEQLDENIASIDVELDAELVENIESIHEQHVYPAP